MRYTWEDLSDSELRIRVARKMVQPYSTTNLWQLVRRRDDPHIAEIIDRLLGNS